MNKFNLSCPYDVIKLYDYQKIQQNQMNNKKEKYDLKYQNEADIKYEKVLFESYCGRKLNFTVFSTHNIFEIEFEMSDSLGNEEYSEDENKILLRKGFKAFYKFSNQFADLSFITGTHITGTSNIIRRKKKYFKKFFHLIFFIRL